MFFSVDPKTAGNFELALLAVIVYTPICNRIFGTAPLDVDVWLFILPFMLAMLGAEEARKWLARQRAAHQ